ncbi:MAG: type III secretion protein [Myxococcaceae bacterium]
MKPLAPVRALAFAVALCAGCAVDLQHDLGEKDANDIYVLLSENGIAAKKLREEGGNVPTYRISVPKQDAAQAMKLLTEHSLPRPMSDGLGAFRKNKGMVPTETEERAMFLEALSGEVSNALNRVDGVLEARAIVMIPEVTDLTQDDKRPLPSASVLVKYRTSPEGKAPIDEERIRSFVSSAVPELRKEAVTILLAESQPPSADVIAEQRLQDVLGIRMTAGSATQFKIIMGLTGLIVLAMAAFTAFSLLRQSGVNLPSMVRRRGNGSE